MHALLAGFSRAVRVDRGEASRDVWLALSLLHKRAFSSPHALAESVARRLSLLASHPTGAINDRVDPQQLFLPLDASEYDAADESPLVHVAFFEDARRERRQLVALADAARAAARHDTTLTRLVRLVAHLHRRGESAIVFTEYRDTLAHVGARLATTGSRPALLLHGGLTRDERASVLDRFTRTPGQLLLATDAAAEGLNLHRQCRLVINLELPWNPMRLEQRIGRVDRIGQQRTVHAVHLIGHEGGEARILSRLRMRIAAARDDLGAPDPLGDERAMARLALSGGTDDDDGQG